MQDIEFLFSFRHDCGIVVVLSREKQHGTTCMEHVLLVWDVINSGSQSTRCDGKQRDVPRRSIPPDTGTLTIS